MDDDCNCTIYGVSSIKLPTGPDQETMSKIEICVPLTQIWLVARLMVVAMVASEVWIVNRLRGGLYVAPWSLGTGKSEKKEQNAYNLCSASAKATEAINDETAYLSVSSIHCSAIKMRIHDGVGVCLSTTQDAKQRSRKEAMLMQNVLSFFVRSGLICVCSSLLAVAKSNKIKRRGLPDDWCASLADQATTKQQNLCIDRH